MILDFHDSYGLFLYSSSDLVCRTYLSFTHITYLSIYKYVRILQNSIKCLINCTL